MNNKKMSDAPEKNHNDIMGVLTGVSEKLGNIESRINTLEDVFIHNGYQQMHRDFAVLDTLVKTGLSDVKNDISAMSNKFTPLVESGAISRIEKIEKIVDGMIAKVDSTFEYVERAKDHKWDVSKIILNIVLVLIFATLVGIKITLL